MSALEHLEHVPFTDAEIRAARQVRTRYGWYDVLYVNPRTVAVSGDFSDVQIPFGTILEVSP